MADGTVTRAVEDMRKYERTLRDRGDMLQARAVVRCIDILRRAHRLAMQDERNRKAASRGD